jgi:hypothetical protein
MVADLLGQPARLGWTTVNVVVTLDYPQGQGLGHIVFLTPNLIDVK